MHIIVLFDSSCIFCNKSVHFIIKRDPKKVFKFAALQSEIGKRLLQEYNIPTDTDSFLVITEDTWYEKSSAVLTVTKELDSLLKYFYILKVIPRPLRDSIYTFIANHRHRLFKSKKSCDLLSSEERSRFLI